MSDLVLKLRGALGNALVWGAGWFVGSVVLLLTLPLLLDLPFQVPGFGAALRGAATFGITGALVGGAFSAYLGLAYRGRDLAGISSALVAVGGAGLAALVSLLVGGSVLIPAVLGAVTAGGSLKVAQRAENRLEPGPVAAALTEGEAV